MAEVLFEIVAENLLTFLREELATFWSVGSEIQSLSSKLTEIRALIEDAEEQQIASHAVKDWLQKLSDAAYVVDDILDACSIQSSFLKSHKIRRLSPKTILFRRDIGNKVKEIVKRIHDIDEKRTFELRAGVIERPIEDDEWRQTCSVIQGPHMYGRDKDKEQIVEFLTRRAGDGEELSVYPIVGMGGLGKTTLASWVFNDDRVIKHFDRTIWVCVSNNFNVMRILESIVESIEGKDPELSTLESMQKRVQQLLLGKKYLLVLDDVWNEDQEKWEKLKSVLQCGSATKGASVLVTTRLDSVASIVGTTQTHHLKPLSEDDNWSLFKHHAFGPNKEGRAELVAIGREIVKKCVGNPLACKVLGSLLQKKDEKKQWLCIKESKFWDIPQGNAVMRALRISYFNLNMFLRRCFSFCAIYPEDSKISKEQLIHLWMANGLIKSRRNSEVEDVGSEVWDELYRRSFFQEVNIDLLGNTTFKIHDLFHELAQSIVGEAFKATVLERLNDLSRGVHHISCSGFYNKRLDIDVFKKFESLRTFVELDRSYRSYGLKGFNSIRALRTSSFQLSGLKSLAHLRYLNIFHSFITTLPGCISRLQKLQILKLEDCMYLSSLPKQLTQLNDLRHLLISGCWSLVKMPPNIGEMKSLKTLNIFILDSKRRSSLTELCDLQLGGKLHIKGLENVRSESDARSVNLMSKKELSQLYLTWGSSSNSKCSNAEKILTALEPHCNLKSFGIKGYMGKQFPSWMINTSVFSCLVSVMLYDCENCEQLPPLGKLPHLAELFLTGMREVKYIDDDSYDGVEEKAFKSLKKLTLLRLPNLEKMLKDERVEMLPILSELRISCVPKLRLPLVPSVERLTIEGLDSDSDDYDMESYSDDYDMASFLEAIVPSAPHVKILRVENLSGLDGLGSLSSLQELDIYACKELESIKENVLQGLSSLRTLKISFCYKLKSLSEGVSHLTCLESLEIMFCPSLVTLPNSMNQLTALRHVAINDNLNLPEGLQRIPSLQSLSIRGVHSLPEWLGDITSLQKLDIIYGSGIRSLPSSFQRLTNLRALHIGRCPQLEKRCERGTGEDWQNIAHIPLIEIVPEPEVVLSDEIQLTRCMLNLPPYCEFDRTIDDEW